MRRGFRDFSNVTSTSNLCKVNLKFSDSYSVYRTLYGFLINDSCVTSVPEPQVSTHVVSQKKTCGEPNHLFISIH